MPVNVHATRKPEESPIIVPRRVLDHLARNRGRYLKDLTEFLEIPSVSADWQFTPDMRRAAGWVLARAEHLGFSGKLFETQGHPIIYAERCLRKTAPTLLIYGHYDVQPAGPLQDWKTLPFVPDVRDGAIYARGATDDKGPILTYLNAMDSIIAADGTLPLNVKLLVEGEEETGSPNIEKFAREHRGMLKADTLALSDTTRFSKNLPAIRYGYRGLVNMQIEVTGPAFSVHSGEFGGILRNPAIALARILCRLKDDDGRVTIPGFYDHVRDVEPWERR